MPDNEPYVERVMRYVTEAEPADYLPEDAVRRVLEASGYPAEVERLRAENERLRAFAFGPAPEWERANATLKHRVRELEAELQAASGSTEDPNPPQ